MLHTKRILVCNDKYAGASYFKLSKKLAQRSQLCSGDVVHFLASHGRVLWAAKRLDKRQHVGGAHLIWSAKIKRRQARTHPQRHS